ncbi:MAG: GNAT family N-acetyltransferase [Pseudomonadota bacterium]
MTIQPATAEDLEPLIPLFAAYLVFYAVPRPLPAIRAFLAARLARSDSAIFLARDGAGQVQGFVQLYPLFASLELAPTWLVSDLYVAEPARRQGLGEALMQAARVHGEATGACGLLLETARTNQAAQALYERLGYVRDTLYYSYWLNLAPA